MKNNVIVACDFTSQKELDNFLKKLKGNKPFLKIGYQLFYVIGRAGISKLHKQGYKIFLDLKLHDIPNTVYQGIKSLKSLHIDMLTVHATGGIEMIKQAKLAAGKSVKILAVTQLTSISQKIIHDELLIPHAINDVVLQYAINAKKAKADGVICSPKEVRLIKNRLGKKFLTVTPGIRYASDNNQDQKRVATPSMAREFGSDYIVVGRPITQSSNPLKMYQKICQDFN